MNCRHCESRLEHTFLDLGFAPPSNAKKYTEAITERLSLDEKSFVIEVASNDGYLMWSNYRLTGRVCEFSAVIGMTEEPRPNRSKL